jgi:hypothetical protein
MIGSRRVPEKALEGSRRVGIDLASRLGERTACCDDSEPFVTDHLEGDERLAKRSFFEGRAPRNQDAPRSKLESPTSGEISQGSYSKLTLK